MYVVDSIAVKMYLLSVYGINGHVRRTIRVLFAMYVSLAQGWGEDYTKAYAVPLTPCILPAISL